MQRIGIVGPCAAGKTTLGNGLNRHGYEVTQIAQEHSYVPEMWKIITNPSILIFLDVSYPVSIARRPQNFTEADYQKQQERLKHARKNADFYLFTDPLSIAQVLEQVIFFLNPLDSP